jgi:hypothetical protein
VTKTTTYRGKLAQKDAALRRKWLREGAPFKVVHIDDLPVNGGGHLPFYSFTRITEWRRQGITHCVIGRDKDVWRKYTTEDALLAAKHNEAPEQYAQMLNDESLFAIITEGTEAEKLV